MKIELKQDFLSQRVAHLIDSMPRSDTELIKQFLNYLNPHCSIMRSQANSEFKYRTVERAQMRGASIG